jgi:cytochrome c-type biogenesis protein CcmH
MRHILALVFLFTFVGLAQAVEPGEALDDPKLEARARELSLELRCLVCQNQSIDDSHASLARDLRLLVRERLKAGDSDEQVRDYLVSRYGEFILLKPPLRLGTALLWLSPFAVLALGGIVIFSLARRRQRNDVVAQLSEDEKARLERLLNS